jgi:hypothetical protein
MSRGGESDELKTCDEDKVGGKGRRRWHDRHRGAALRPGPSSGESVRVCICFFSNEMDDERKDLGLGGGLADLQVHLSPFGIAPTRLQILVQLAGSAAPPFTVKHRDRDDEDKHGKVVQEAVDECPVPPPSLDIVARSWR